MDRVRSQYFQFALRRQQSAGSKVPYDAFDFIGRGRVCWRHGSTGDQHGRREQVSNTLQVACMPGELLVVGGPYVRNLSTNFGHRCSGPGILSS